VACVGKRTWQKTQSNAVWHNKRNIQLRIIESSRQQNGAKRFQNMAKPRAMLPAFNSDNTADGGQTARHAASF
jgi:hypothetical protein